MAVELNARIPAGPLADKWDKHRFEMKLVNPANKRKYTVLVVGSGLAGASAAATMSELGYQVLEASEGDQALELLKARQDVQLLFTDVVLPGLNGRQLADEALRIRPDLKVLFTTGYTAANTVDAKTRAQFKGFLARCRG